MAERKTVLITGCSKGGIGDALAREFHRKGHRVFASARNLSKVQHLDDLGIETLLLDVTDETSIKEAVKKVTEYTGGTLDFLINNSGGGYGAPLLDSDVAAVKKMFDVNVFAVIAVTAAFSPLLIAAKGTLINIGSVAGKSPVPWQGGYNASKAALNHLTDQYRIELAPFDVKVVNVITGGVKSHFWDNLEVAHLPKGSVYEAATDEIEVAMGGKEVDVIEIDVYAQNVVANALRLRPKRHLWIGGKAWDVWAVCTFGWESIWDILLRRPYKLDVVERKIRAAQALK